MDISTNMSSIDKAMVDLQVDTFNKSISDGRVKKNELGKDDFLKILITQLSHQDPTKPMEDKEFIAQMAQFSSLEQMTKLSSDFTQVADRLQVSQAMDMLGKSVQINTAGGAVNGEVTQVTGGSYPQLLVNGKYYNLSEVTNISE